MTSIQVELAVLLSILNGENILHVTNNDTDKVVSHIVGKEVSGCEEAYNKAKQWIQEKNPKVAEAANLVKRLIPDEGRYNKLIDLFRKNHQVLPMVA